MENSYKRTLTNTPHNERCGVPLHTAVKSQTFTLNNRCVRSHCYSRDTWNQTEVNQNWFSKKKGIAFDFIFKIVLHTNNVNIFLHDILSGIVLDIDCLTGIVSNMFVPSL